MDQNSPNQWTFAKPTQIVKKIITSGDIQYYLLTCPTRESHYNNRVNHEAFSFLPIRITARRLYESILVYKVDIGAHKSPISDVGFFITGNYVAPLIDFMSIYSYRDMVRFHPKAKTKKLKEIFWWQQHRSFFSIYFCCKIIFFYFHKHKLKTTMG